MEGINVTGTIKPCEDFRSNNGGVVTAEGLVWEVCAPASAGASKPHKCKYGGLLHDVGDEGKEDEDECEHEVELRPGVPEAGVSFKVCDRRLERALLIARLDEVD